MFSIQDFYFIFPTATILASLIHEEAKYYFFLSRSSKTKAPWMADKGKKLQKTSSEGLPGLISDILNISHYENYFLTFGAQTSWIYFPWAAKRISLC